MTTRNQCDGCCRGLSVDEHGHHRSEGYDIIACTAHRYTETRLTMVSFWANGKRHTAFVQLPHVNGRPVMSWEAVQKVTGPLDPETVVGIGR